MKSSRTCQNGGFTLIEVMVAGAVLAVTMVIATQAMLTLNKNAALSRMTNLAKAMALGRIQEVAAEGYDPAAKPPVVPSNLTAGSTTTQVNLGDASTQLGPSPASLTWTVTDTGTSSILSVRCRVSYAYLGKLKSYEVLTYRAPD